MNVKPAVTALLTAVAVLVGVLVGRLTNPTAERPPSTIDTVNYRGGDNLPVRGVVVDGERVYFNSDVPFEGKAAAVRFDIEVAGERKQIVVWVQVPPK